MTQKKDAADMFDDWVGMWDKAQNDGTFDSAPKPAVPATNHTFFGLQSTAPDTNVAPSESDTEYWNQVYQRSNNAGDSPDIAAPEIFQEHKKPVVVPKKKKKKILPLSETRQEKTGKVAKSQLKSPNPIYYYSAGKDQDLHVTPNWTDGKELTELHDMKLKLHQLEDKMNTMIGGGKPEGQVRQIESELKKLRKRLDELSDSLHVSQADDTKD